MSPRLIALTGATGFLGSHIADVLLARGFAVRAAVRASSNLRWIQGKKLETVIVDLTDSESCAGFLAGSSGLIHCAGAVMADNDEQYHQANVQTTETLLKQAQIAWDQETDGTFVLISSLAAHGPAGIEQPALETDTNAPITAYGRSKLDAEKAVQKASWNFRRAILRPPSLYGPRDAEFLPLFKAARRGFTARLGRSMTGLSLVHGQDAATAAVALLECQRASGVFFVDDGHGGYNWSELADLLACATGKKIRTIPVPLGLLKFMAYLMGGNRSAASAVLNRDRIRDLETPGWVCKDDLLRETTGWAPNFKAPEGFANTLDFFREQRWL